MRRKMIAAAFGILLGVGTANWGGTAEATIIGGGVHITTGNAPASAELVEDFENLSDIGDDTVVMDQGAFKGSTMSMNTFGEDLQVIQQGPNILYPEDSTKFMINAGGS